MIAIASSLAGINLLDMAGDLQRVKVAGVDIIDFEISTGKSTPPGPFGEFMIANVAGWTNMCINVQLLDSVDFNLIENVVACGADILTIPSSLISTPVLNKIHELGPIISIRIDIGDVEEPLSYKADMVYLVFEKISSSHNFKKVTEVVDSVRTQQPDAVVAVKLPVSFVLSPEIGNVLPSVDLISTDFFQVEDPWDIITKLRKHSKHKTHPHLKRALPHGLPIKRDDLRLLSIFDAINAKIPPPRIR